MPNEIPELPANSTLGQLFLNDPERIQRVLQELAIALRIVQNRVDDLQDRVAKLEQDRLESPGWVIDEGE